MIVQDYEFEGKFPVAPMSIGRPLAGLCRTAGALVKGQTNRLVVKVRKQSYAAAVKSVLLVGETHHGLLWHGSGRLSPDRGGKAHTFLKLPRWAKASALSHIPLGQAPAHPKRDHDKYQAVEVDGAAFLFHAA